MADQKQLRALSDEYEKLQGGKSHSSTPIKFRSNKDTEMSELVQARQKLESQFTENQGVKKANFQSPPSCTYSTDFTKEFASLDEEANIYKLVGPVLLKQDPTEARSTVDSRLEYIEKEM